MSFLLFKKQFNLTSALNVVFLVLLVQLHKKRS